MIIVLYGPSRSGKDTVAALLGDKERLGKAKFKRLAFGDKIRQILLDCDPWVTCNDGSVRKLTEMVAELGWDGVKASSRESVDLMIRLGQGARDIIGENVWVDPVIPHLKNRQNYVITDCRQPNELEALQERGAYFWKIERPGVEVRGMDGLLDKFDGWDAVLVNDGTIEDLSDRVFEEYESLKSRSRSDSMDRYRARREAEDPDWKRRTHLSRRYKMTMEEFDDKLQDQGEVCALCKKRPQDLLAVDHDHRCCPGLNSCGDCIRGLLCTACNMMVGVIENDQEWAERALSWLDTRWRKNDVL